MCFASLCFPLYSSASTLGKCYLAAQKLNVTKHVESKHSLYWTLFPVEEIIVDDQVDLGLAFWWF